MKFFQKPYFVHALHLQFSESAAGLEIHSFTDKMSAHPNVCVKPVFPLIFSGVCDENCHLLKEHSLLSVLQPACMSQELHTQVLHIPTLKNGRKWKMHPMVCAWPSLSCGTHSQVCVWVCSIVCHPLKFSKIQLQPGSEVKGQRGRVRDFWEGSGIWELPVLPLINYLKTYFAFPPQNAPSCEPHSLCRGVEQSQAHLFRFQLQITNQNPFSCPPGTCVCFINPAGDFRMLVPAEGGGQDQDNIS